MRKSVIKGDAGYDAESMFYEVYLNGERVEGCVTADEELGICLCYGEFKAGNINEWDYVELHGEVRIKRIDNARIN